MIESVISGGQTGVDQAALRAARAAGISTGGHAPRGWKTESGPSPWLADYALIEHPSSDYRERTRTNILSADGTLILSDRESSGGTLLAFNLCSRLHTTRYAVLITDGRENRGWAVAVLEVKAWVEGHGVRTLNVAGPRESKSPGFGVLAESFLSDLFSLTNRGPHE